MIFIWSIYRLIRNFKLIIGKCINQFKVISFSIQAEWKEIKAYLLAQCKKENKFKLLQT